MKRKPRKYQVGGREPIYTSNPKDPRLKAYNDSLALHNKTKDIQNPKYYNKGEEPSWYNWKGDLNKADAFMRRNNVDVDYEYHRNGKFPGKIQPVKVGDFGEGMAYPIYKKPVQPVIYKKPEAVKPQEKKSEFIKKVEQVIEKPSNEYSGNPVYANTPYSRGAAALIGFENKGDTTYIAPEDYERFAVPNYGRKIIESNQDMKKKLKKYQIGGNGYKPPKITEDDIYLLEKMDREARISNSEATPVRAYYPTLPKEKQPQKPQVDSLGLASGILKGSNMAVGAIADFVNESRNRTAENKQYYSSLRDTEESEFVQNDIPLYTKFGGGFPRDKALKILRDGKVNGRPLSKGQKKFFATMAFRKAMDGADLMESPDMWQIMMEGGDIPEVMGLPENMEDQAWIEAEAGEVYKQPDGQVLKISDDGDRHEEGGEYISNVEKVLEDTSTSRRDSRSKALAVNPEAMKALFGIDVNKKLSHSEALEVVSADLDKNTMKVKSKLSKVLKSLDKTPNNKYAQNSLEFNVKELQKYPSKEEIFDTLFNHQESLKEEMNMKQAKYGIALPKAQDGLEVLYNKANAPGAKKLDILAFQKAFHADERTKGYAKDLVSGRGAITKYGQTKGYKQDDVRQNEDGIMGTTTKQYFKYFEDNKALPNLPDVVLPKLNLKEEEGSIEPPVEQVVEKPKDVINPAAPAAQQAATPTQYSDFNEPLRWTDIMAPAAAYLSADRIPAKYNPAEFKKVDPRLENVLPYLQQGQRDFNTVAGMTENSGSGQANLANVFAQKYAIDNQTRAAVNDRNLQRQGAADIYNAQVSDKQSGANQQARAVFEQQQLMGIEAQRKQKLQSLDEILQRVNLNRKQNREGDLLMKLFPNFNSRGEFNGNNRYMAPQGNAAGATSAKGNPYENFMAISVPDGSGKMVDMLIDKTTGKPVSLNSNQSNGRSRTGR